MRVVPFVLLEAVLRASAGDSKLADVGQLLVGVAAVVAAVAGLTNGRRLTHVQRKAASAAKATSNLSAAVGAPNGTSVLDLLHEIKAFEEYQHGRNHDVLAALAVLRAATPTLIEAIDRLIARLDQEGTR